MNNGLSQRKTKWFLKEFAGKYVTGGTIYEMKNNPQLIDELKQEFSKENKIFGIWVACVRKIGEWLMIYWYQNFSCQIFLLSL